MIKYKAWDKELKQIFEVIQLDFSDWWVQCNVPENAPRENGRAFYGERNSFNNEETDRHIILPYTGLKDINDKEIYKGYICKDDVGTILEIVWVEDKFQFGAKVIKGCTLSKDLTFPLWQWNNCKENGYRSLEVIGNIYENTEII